MPDPEPTRVICNTSPIYYLNRIGLLDLLRLLYHQIAVTDAVVGELEAGRSAGLPVPDISKLPWVRITNAARFTVPDVWPDLGAGESSTILLALEASERAIVILDDLTARRLAAWKRLRITGTAGVLLKAKQRRLISEVKPSLDKLLDQGFRLKRELYEHILSLAHEL